MADLKRPSGQNILPRRQREETAVRIPNYTSDTELGLTVVLLLLAGGAMWLYNAWRMGRWGKSAGRVDPWLVGLGILLGIALAALAASLTNF